MMSPGTNSRSGISFAVAVTYDRCGHVDHGLELLRGRICPDFLKKRSPRSAPPSAPLRSQRGRRPSGGDGGQSRQQDHQRLRMIFRMRLGQPCLRFFAISFGPVARARSSASLRQAGERRTQLPNQCLAVLAGGI